MGERMDLNPPSPNHHTAIADAVTALARLASIVENSS
jgi:hypothetical protein